MALAALLVDDREPPKVINHLRSALAARGIEVVSSRLPAGDFHAVCDDGALLVLERKTPSDFLNSLRSSRLLEQAAACRALSDYAYLVITGDLRAAPNDHLWYADGSALGVRETGWSWNSVQGALLSLQECGVGTLMCDGELALPELLVMLGNRDRGAVRVRPARAFELVSEAEAILLGIPGIGPDRARALLEACGSAAWALAALTDGDGTDVAVPGIGRGVHRLARGALGLGDDDLRLAVVSAAGLREYEQWREVHDRHTTADADQAAFLKKVEAEEREGTS